MSRMGQPRVAIVGAGLSGLACAIGLERRGLHPDVFEKRAAVGGRFANVEGFLRLADAPFGDALRFLSREYGLRLSVPGPIERFEINSRRRRAVVRGPLGYLTLRGDQEGALEKQLGQVFGGRVQCEREVDPLALIDQYDLVVVADGQETTPKRLGLWHEVAAVRGAAHVVEGAVDPTEIVAWLDPELGGHGYAYILPWRPGSAMAAIYDPDASEDEHARHRANFVEVLRERGLTVRPLEDSQINNYQAGYPERYQEGRLVFVGNAGGCLEALAAFGQLPAMVSGFSAARAIADGRPYRGYPGQNQGRRAGLALRRLLDTFTAEDFDRWVGVLAALPFRDQLFSTDLPLRNWLGLLLWTFWPPAREQLGESPTGGE